jgi:hypothetical protein
VANLYSITSSARAGTNGSLTFADGWTSFRRAKRFGDAGVRPALWSRQFAAVVGWRRGVRRNDQPLFRRHEEALYLADRVMVITPVQ